MEINQFSDIFTDPILALKGDYKKVHEILEDCVFVFDTNILLLAYTDRGGSVSIIRSVIEKLCSEEKLFFPKQVLKEFAKNRPDKLKEAIKEIGDYKSRIKIDKVPNHRKFLNEFEEYNKILNAYDDIRGKVNDYISLVKEFEKHLKDNFYTEPVLSLYKEYITEERIINNPIDIKEIKAEMKTRYQYKIPPGYKDGGKTDEGIGDYVIWKDILWLGKEKNKNVVFVTGDEKADWCIRIPESGMLPRFELSYEFKEYSGGCDFGLIQLGQLIDYLNKDNKNTENKLILIKNTTPGWQQNEIDWYFNDRYGNAVKNTWEKSGSYWFYLNDEGYISRDKLIEDSDGIRYVNERGEMIRNSINVVNGNEMYFDYSGVALKGGKITHDGYIYTIENGIVVGKENQPVFFNTKTNE